AAARQVIAGSARPACVPVGRADHGRRERCRRRERLRAGVVRALVADIDAAGEVDDYGIPVALLSERVHDIGARESVELDLEAVGLLSGIVEAVEVAERTERGRVGVASSGKSDRSGD